jgi:hypothetical protein
VRLYLPIALCPPYVRNLSQVDGLSELFVVWDETLRRAEDRVTKLEKEREERSRRGYD